MIKISTRVVIIFKTHVYKFPISRRGYLQCKNEAEVWNKYKHPMLGVLIWEKFGIVKMKRYSQAKQLPHSNIAKIKQEIQELNISNCDLYNVKNWGFNKGKYILLDYGINEKISKMYK